MIDITDIPFFMENKDWYYYDGHMYKLTEKAPEKAIESYNEFYKQINAIYEEKEGD